MVALIIFNLLLSGSCDRDVSPSPLIHFPWVSAPEDEEKSLTHRPNQADLDDDYNNNGPRTRTGVIHDIHTENPSPPPTHQSPSSPKQREYQNPRSQPCSLSPFQDNSRYDYGSRRPSDRFAEFPTPPSTDASHHHHDSSFTGFLWHRSLGIPPSRPYRFTSSRPVTSNIDMFPGNGRPSMNSNATGYFSQRHGSEGTTPVKPTTQNDFDDFSTTDSSPKPRFVKPSPLAIVSNQQTSTTLNITESKTPTNFCIEGTPVIEINLENCPTCKRRCGIALSLSNEAGEKYACSCDSTCLVYQDCCPDFEFMCTEEHFQGMLTLNGMSSATGTTCLTLKMGSGSRAKFLFINECNGTTYTLVDSRVIPNADDGVPVEDLNTGVFFINYNCAKCHGATELRPMEVKLQYTLPPCHDIYTTGTAKPDFLQAGTTSLFSRFSERPNATTPPITDILPTTVNGKINTERSHIVAEETMLHFLNNPDRPHELRFDFLGEQARQCYDEVVAGCSESCTNMPLQELCLNSGLLYSMYKHDSFASSLNFKNIYCAICNLEFDESVSCGNIANMGDDNDDDLSFLLPRPGESAENSPAISAFSLSVLFDFKSASSISSMSVICDEDQVLLPNGMACGDIICPAGYILQNDTCTQFHPLQNYTWDFLYQVEINSSFDCVFCQNNTIVNSDSIISNIASQMDTLVNAVSENISILSVENYCVCENLLLSNVTIRVDFGQGDVYVRSNVTLSLEREGTTILLNHLLNYLYEANSTVVFSRVTFYAFNLSPISSELEHICAGYLVSDKDFVITGTDLILQESGHIYHDDEYILQNGSAFICYEPQKPGSEDHLAAALAIVTIVLSILSISCICLRLILQFTTKRYKSAANRMQFQLCLALGLSTGLLILTPIAASNPPLCYIFSVIKYFSYMSTFAWMTCVAGDTWRVLKKSELCIQDNPNRSLVKYFLVSWLLPLIISGLAVGLDYLPIPDQYKPKFGGWACWITNMKGILLYFVTPVSAFITINMIFFVLTSSSLRKTFKSANEVRTSTDKSKQYFVYFKLFILMGLTWIIGIIAAWADTPAVWFLFIFLNTSQGMFIFFAFVFELRYLRLLIRKCCHRFTYDESTEVGQQSTSKSTVTISTHTNDT